MLFDHWTKTVIQKYDVSPVARKILSAWDERKKQDLLKLNRHFVAYGLLGALGFVGINFGFHTIITEYNIGKMFVLLLLALGLWGMLQVLQIALIMQGCKLGTELNQTLTDMGGALTLEKLLHHDVRVIRDNYALYLNRLGTDLVTAEKNPQEFAIQYQLGDMEPAGWARGRFKEAFERGKDLGFVPIDAAWGPYIPQTT